MSERRRCVFCAKLFISREAEIQPKDLVDYVAKRYPDYLRAPDKFSSADAKVTGQNFYRQVIDRARGERS